MTATLDLVADLRDAGQDFEWYPTTRAMVDAVLKDISSDDRVGSVLDIGAGDGRVLIQLSETWTHAKLYAIEKAPLLQQAQPDRIVPVGTLFEEQDLMSLPCDVVFSNPPYSVFEEWAARIISTVHADTLYLILPQRWEASDAIAAALKDRAARAKVIYRGDFLEAERRARAVVHIIRVRFRSLEDAWQSKKQDPFDLWFDQNISTFDTEKPVGEYEQEERALARLRGLESIGDLVAAFNDDYARMQEHYKAIFQLDAAILKEVGVDKNSVREGLKKRMAGLKHTYWQSLFEHLNVITARLTTKTKKRFLDRINGQTAIAFTESNAYAVVLWAIKAANQYFDAQVVDVFRALSTHDGVENYVSNQRTWQDDDWRYARWTADHEDRDGRELPSRYKLDYRIVVHHYSAIFKGGFVSYNYPGNLHTSAHELIDDLVAVFGNLGFVTMSRPSRSRTWYGNTWQNWHAAGGDDVLFQVKGFQNGNLHFRMMPDAIKALNIEAARLLGWVRGPRDIVTELGYTGADAEKFFGCNQRLGASNVKLLAAAETAGRS